MIIDILKGWPVAETLPHSLVLILLADWPSEAPFSCGVRDVPLVQPSTLPPPVELRL